MIGPHDEYISAMPRFKYDLVTPELVDTDKLKVVIAPFSWTRNGVTRTYSSDSGYGPPDGRYIYAHWGSSIIEVLASGKTSVDMWPDPRNYRLLAHVSAEGLITIFHLGDITDLEGTSWEDLTVEYPLTMTPGSAYNGSVNQEIRLDPDWVPPYPYWEDHVAGDGLMGVNYNGSQTVTWEVDWSRSPKIHHHDLLDYSTDYDDHALGGEGKVFPEKGAFEYPLMNDPDEDFSRILTRNGDLYMGGEILASKIGLHLDEDYDDDNRWDHNYFNIKTANHADINSLEINLDASRDGGCINIKCAEVLSLAATLLTVKDEDGVAQTTTTSPGIIRHGLWHGPSIKFKTLTIDGEDYTFVVWDGSV